MRYKDKESQHKNTVKYSKKIVAVCITFTILYTIVQLLLSYMLQVEISPTLTTCVYAFFGTELASCALIKIFEKPDNKDSLLEYLDDITNLNTYQGDDSNG